VLYLQALLQPHSRANCMRAANDVESHQTWEVRRSLPIGFLCAKRSESVGIIPLIFAKSSEQVA